MYIVRTGLINSVLSMEQYEQIKNKEIKPEDIVLEDTIQEFTNEQGETIKYLPFKISYKDTDKNGKEKFIFNEETQEFQQNYFYSPIIYAYGKEMRILLELGVREPIKIVYQEQWKNGKLYRTAVCIQDQKAGIKLDD